MLFLDLPLEIVVAISTYCTPADIVNLAVAFPPIAESIAPGIYACIVVDPVPRRLCAGRATKRAWVDARNQQICSATQVQTVAGVKGLLASLTGCPQYARMVRSFTVRGNIWLSDIALIPAAEAALCNLVNLRELEWTACPELSPHVLGALQCARDTLLALKVDLALQPGEIWPQMNDNELEFPYLRELAVRPFLHAEALRWAVQLGATELSHLRLGRILDGKHDAGSYFPFIGQRRPTLQTVTDHFVFFGRRQQKLELRTLELLQIDTCETDICLLDGAVDLKGLRELRLTGTGHEIEHGHCVLTYIAECGPQLTKAELNWSASVRATCLFLNRCGGSLKSLKLNVKHHRVLKMLPLSCPQLEHLELAFEGEYSLVDLAPVAEFKALRVLGLPFCFAVNSWEIAFQLPKLKVLKLEKHEPTGTRSSGGLTGMGLLTNEIIDQWNDRMPSPFQCANIMATAREMPALEYVAVDGHVTTMRPGPPLEEYSFD